MSRCPICSASYSKRSTWQKVCGSVECAAAFAKKEREKMDRKAQRERDRIRRMDIARRREAIKTRSDYIREAQIAFNAWIRWRDRLLPCICCGLPLGDGGVGGGYDCGHYRSVGSAPQHRYNEFNAAAQRKRCNRWGAGRAVDYRIGLIARIGREAVEALEDDNVVRKWTVAELIEIRDFYRAELKAARRSDLRMAA